MAASLQRAIVSRVDWAPQPTMMGREEKPAASRAVRVVFVTRILSAGVRWTASPLEPCVAIPARPARARVTAWWEMAARSSSSLSRKKQGVGA